MPVRQTFAQYLINKILPDGIQVDKQVDKGVMNGVLSQVANRYPDRYDRVVSNLKRLADHISTMEALTIGLDEIDVPNKAKRDAIINKYQKIVAKHRESGDQNALNSTFVALQDELATNDLSGSKDDATVMVTASLTGKKNQLMKMRTSPGVVGSHDGSIVPVVFPKTTPRAWTRSTSG